MAKLLCLDEYEMFDTPAIFILDTDTSDIELLTINACSVPDKMTALNIVDYPKIDDFLVENQFVRRANAYLLTEGVKYPEVIPCFETGTDITKIYNNYKRRTNK